MLATFFGFGETNRSLIVTSYILGILGMILSFLVKGYLHNPGDIHSLKPQIKVEMLILKKWKPPQVGSFCVNTDGPVKDQFALAGCGGLIRDHQGRWMGSFAKKTGCASPIVA